MSSAPKDGHAIKLNGAIYSSCTVLKLVAASAAEAELGALFLNAQEAKNNKTHVGRNGTPTATHPNAL